MKLIRKKTSEKGTFGSIELPSGKILQTLELPWRNNKVKVSSIPATSYTCKITNSPKFGHVYEVKNVEGRSHILIHAGNWISDIQGCIMVGMSADDNRLYNSKKALNLLMTEMADKDFTLEIVEDYAE